MFQAHWRGVGWPLCLQRQAGRNLFQHRGLRTAPHVSHPKRLSRGAGIQPDSVFPAHLTVHERLSAQPPLNPLIESLPRQSLSFSVRLDLEECLLSLSLGSGQQLGLLFPASQLPVSRTVFWGKRAEYPVTSFDWESQLRRLRFKESLEKGRSLARLYPKEEEVAGSKKAIVQLSTLDFSPDLKWLPQTASSNPH